MNCCDRILILFLAFSFAQFSFRWEVDKNIIQAPWQIHVIGSTNKTLSKSSTLVQYIKYATHYGTPTAKVKDTHIYTDDRQEIFILLKASVSGPPMSFHRIQLTMGNRSVQEMSLFISPTGQAHGSMYVQAIHAPLNHIRLHYLFDDVWDINDSAMATVEMVICSGHPSLWDVTWYPVYK